MDFFQVILFLLVMAWYVYSTYKAQTKRQKQAQLKNQNPPPSFQEKAKSPPQLEPFLQPPVPRRLIPKPQKIKQKSKIKNLINSLPDKKSLFLLSEILKRK